MPRSAQRTFTTGTVAARQTRRLTWKRRGPERLGAPGRMEANLRHRRPVPTPVILKLASM
jgi:hypothetical protein